MAGPTEMATPPPSAVCEELWNSNAARASCRSPAAVSLDAWPKLLTRNVCGGGIVFNLQSTQRTNNSSQTYLWWNYAHKFSNARCADVFEICHRESRENVLLLTANFAPVSRSRKLRKEKSRILCSCARKFRNFHGYGTHIRNNQPYMLASGYIRSNNYIANTKILRKLKYIWIE